jgi:predicted RNA binding protein YcfA (HicA-like mRNA interferase family)
MEAPSLSRGSRGCQGKGDEGYDQGVDSREVLKRLEAAGWTKAAQKGSHIQLKHSARTGRVTVPHPKKDLPKGTLKSIERQSGIKLS